MIPSPKIFGLIGYPVTHSLSPLMHNAAFKALNLDARYGLFELKPQELENFLKSLSKKNIYGLNVTIPYKEQVIPFLDRISAQAGLIGAVNTIRALQDKLEGFNTDGEGFLKHLTEDLGFSPEGKTVSVIGAGGAAKAVTVYLAKAGVKRVTIYDTQEEKLKNLLAHLKASFKGTEFNQAHSIEGLKINNSDLLVNATPIGMKEADPLIVSEGQMHRGLLVYDLIYNPKETKLLKLAREKGAMVSNGLGMLLYQGMLSFEIWTGKIAPKEIMRKALEDKLC
mgnify:FL=1